MDVLPPSALAAALVLLFGFAWLLTLGLDDARRRTSGTPPRQVTAAEAPISPLSGRAPSAPEHPVEPAVPIPVPRSDPPLATAPPADEPQSLPACPTLLHDLAALNVTLSTRGARLLLGEDELKFASGQAELGPSTPARLGQVAILLARHAKIEAWVVGYTDCVGAEEDNLRLSEARAAAVAARLIELGAPAARIHIVGRGATQPIADNATAAGRARNRRVELELTLPD